MRAEIEHVSTHERMARLEDKADLLRARFARALDALDTRRHQVAAVGKQAKAMAKPAMMTLLGLGALVGLGVLAVGAAWRAKRHRKLSNRISDGVAHAIQRVDAARTPSLARQTFERLILTVVTFAATELAKRAAKNAADGRYPGGRLAT